MTALFPNDAGVAVELSDGEAFILGWQRGELGGFMSSLAEAMARADPLNLDRLAKAFPEEALAMREWRFGGMHKRLEGRGFSL